MEGTGSDRPNILWLSTEDIGPHLGCYGDPLAHTPHIDALAGRGIRFTRAFTVSGVCSPNRSAIITGVYPTTLGTHPMRSGGEGTERSIMPHLPEAVKPFSTYLREAGYYCTNNGKEDYNFPTPESAWDESGPKAHWKYRQANDQPFFAVFNNADTHEGSVRSTGETYDMKTRRLDSGERQDPDKNIPPPFHPDTPVVRENWAKYRELITGMDYWVGDHLEALEEAGLAEDTIVFFWSDHGAGLPRSKRWLYDSGTHIPLIVYIPEKYRKENPLLHKAVNDRLVSTVDLAPTVLALCGIPIPDAMQGRPFLFQHRDEPRAYAYGARDRMDERYDIIRMVRGKRFKYLRNYQPFKPYDQFMNSAEKSPVKREFHRLAEAGALKSGQDWFLQDRKPLEELYDLENDPHELHNLAGDPQYRLLLENMRRAHRHWMLKTGDLGLIPEPQLVVLEKRYGSRYAIARGLETKHPGFFKELLKVASLAGRPRENQITELTEALDHEVASIRYWGAIGLGVLGNSSSQKASNKLSNHLSDPAPVVRVAAAHALFKIRKNEDAALETLRRELRSDREWVRLHAALALDAIGEKARPVIPELMDALGDTHNKYVVRVANRALNQLQETNRQVP